MSEAVRASLVSVSQPSVAVYRSSVRATPGTPLRVLCIAALDTLHRASSCAAIAATKNQRAGRVPGFSGVHQRGVGSQGSVRGRIRGDPAAPGGGRPEGHGSRNISIGFGNWKDERPSIGGDDRRFNEVRVYREAVARLSLATVVAIALNARSLDEALRATRLRQRCGHALSDRDAVPDHRRRAGLHRGCVRRLAKFPDGNRVAASGDRIDWQRVTELRRESSVVWQRDRPAAHGAVCPHRDDDTRPACDPSATSSRTRQRTSRKHVEEPDGDLGGASHPGGGSAPHGDSGAVGVCERYVDASSLRTRGTCHP